jgi:hypothetical protein
MASVRDGELGAGVRSPAGGDQRLLGPRPRGLGPDRGQHARSAVGMAELPFRIPVEIEAEVLLKG